MITILVRRVWLSIEHLDNRDILIQIIPCIKAKGDEILVVKDEGEVEALIWITVD